MSDRLHALVNGTPSILFQLEGVALSFNDAPLRSPYLAVSLIAQFSDLIQHDPRHTLLFELVAQVQGQLQDKLSDRAFFSGEFDSQLLLWTSELRSQYMLVESFYLPSDLDELRRYSQALLKQQEVSQSEGGTILNGRFEGRVEQLSSTLERLSEVGFWEITHGVNALDSSTQDASVLLDLTLSTGLSKSDITSKFCGQWRWYEQEFKETSEANFIDHNTSNLAVMLRQLAVVREQWRNNPTIADVYSQLEQQVMSASVLLGGLFQCDVGADLRVLSEVVEHVNQNYPVQIVIANGLVEVRLSNALQRYELALPYQPVYKVSSEGFNIIVPSYAILPANKAEELSGYMTLVDGSWCQTDMPIADKEVLYWLQAGQVFALYGDKIERVYAMPLRAHYLPPDVINIWRVRDDFIAEPAVLGQYSIDVASIQYDVSQYNEASEDQPIKVQVYRDHYGECIMIASRFVEAVISSDKGEVYRKRFLLYQDELLVIVNRLAEGLQGVFVVVKIGTVRYALHCQGIEHSYVEPCEDEVHVLDESFDWVDGWLSGERQNVRIMSEACGCAIYSKLLEAI